MARTTNIGYWEQILSKPTSSYSKLFKAEEKYLLNKISRNASVLDIGCGEGRNMRTISNITPFVTGLDSDPKALEDAKVYFSKMDTVHLVEGSAAKLPFADDAFDIVTVLMILPNLAENKEAVFKEVARVVKPQGKILLSTFSEKAFKERIKMYQKANVPIEKIEGTTVILDGGVVSEQFTLQQISDLANQAGLRLTDYLEVVPLAYLCELRK